MLSQKSLDAATATADEVVRVRIVGHAIRVRGEVVEVGSETTMTRSDAQGLTNTRPPTVELLA